MSNVPAGWYPDPAGSPQSRWWNGTSWGDLQPAQAPAFTPAPFGAAEPFANAQPYSYGAQQYSYYGQPLVAPSGANPNTTQGWLIALWPLLGLVVAGVYAAVGGFDLFKTYIFATIAMPDLVNVGLSVLTWLGMVGVAYLDYRELQRRQIPSPFHWAFAFIPLPIVYVIGRSVTVHARTRRGLGPLFVWIGATLTYWIASAVIAFAVSYASFYP